jgi:nitroimidazol reductase NimA-like FMN-containing flavoprotein (pyridoxamine 5'-phosphate oxidase superfamily)
VDLAPGIDAAARHPDLGTLDPAECRTLLAAYGIGRLVVSTPDGPDIVPVNFTVVDGALVYRTAPGTTPALAPGADVAFELDHIDEALDRGWSVLVSGPAEHVTGPDTVQHLAAAARSRSWAGGDRELWVRIAPKRITGRRIRAR